ncbi:unnamed protein product [Mytilus coruscus]|uniref:DNA 3'-5' helicase n=1 Tax=Mytilus coruscus TaxID=42192 RepID=A0A6J8DQG3_MYTCO|nr:unnamed protein product [Mytilus coruscus]
MAADDTVKDFKEKLKNILTYKIALTKINSTRKVNLTFLKPLQLQSIQGAMKSDALIILPTGYGKSLIFEMLAKMNNTKCIIISPLNAIIEEQTRKLGSKAVNVNAALTNSLEGPEGRDFKNGPVDRPNIKIIVKKRLPLTGGKTTAEGSFHDVLNPYIEELCSEIGNVPKTIIYSKLKWCGIGYDMVSQAARLVNNTQEILSAVSQFHAPCTDEIQNGSIKLLFATQAYSMGTDAPDVERVCHIGPPSSLECKYYGYITYTKGYLQEIGRAGRDGRQSSAFMHYNMSDIATNTIVQPEVREFCLLKHAEENF